jgi:hypothetical protein
MTKVAVFAAAVLGLAGWASNAQAVTVNFSEVGIHAAGNNSAMTSPFDGGNYTLTFAAGSLYWGNTAGNGGFFYGVNNTTVDTSYMPGTTTPWSVTITADPGLEILFDDYTVARPPGSDDQVNISVTGTTVSPAGNQNQATTFGGANGDIFFRSFATKSRGTSTTLSWTDGAGNDVAIDSFSFTVQAIPEPTVLAPMALAGMGMFLRRRRA